MPTRGEIPEVCVSRWWIVMSFLSSGTPPKNFAIESSRRSLPAIRSLRIPAAVTGLLVDAISK